MQLTAQRLPPGQIEGATSIWCPRDEHHFLTAQARESEHVAVQIIECEVGSFGTDKSTVSERLRSDRPQPRLFVVHECHP